MAENHPFSHNPDNFGTGIGALFGAEISAAALMPYIFVPFLNLFVVLMGFLGGKHIFSVTEPALLASGFISGLIACLDYADGKPSRQPILYF